MECSQETTRRVYACAGCADVGQAADLAARSLRKSGFATPGSSCLAGIGAGIQSFIDAANESSEVITIDGCGVGCAKKTIENIGLTPNSFVLTDMGCVKGGTACTTELVNRLASDIVNQPAPSLNK
jgi:uncharacterized metal-binding protein